MGDAQHEQKRLLRGRYTAARRALAPDVAARLAAIATERLCALAPFRSARALGAYAAVAGEIDPAPAVTTASASGCPVYFPAMRDDAIEFLDAGRGLRPGWRQIPEPYGSTRMPDEGPGTVILVPGVAFDDRGRRLGRGGGHYDRALTAFPRSIRVGFAYEFQLVEHVPVEPWDIPMHYVVTEARVIAARPASDKENRA